MSRTASERALLYLYTSDDHHGVSCYDVGGAVWPERTGRTASASGGGDYAAQMLLGRLKKAGLVEYAPSKRDSRWRLSAKGQAEARVLGGAKSSASELKPRTRPDGTEACVCGCAIETHGNDPEYPGSTSCTECECVAYEADLDAAGAST